MKIAHLSHTDLDGYSCQFVSNYYLKDIKFFNSNYGREIDEKLTMILDYIGDDKGVILISDLNLSHQQCKKYEDLIKDKDIKLFLLDHHQTGAPCMQGFSWYFLDNSRCATKICYDFFSSIYGENQKLKEYCDVVNAIDIWLKDDENFELGKICMNTISTSKEINKVMFEDSNMEYYFYLMNEFTKFMKIPKAHIELDNKIHSIKKEFFKEDEDETLNNLVSRKIVSFLKSCGDKFDIYYKGHKGILTYNIGSVSVIGNDFLVANPDYDFFLDVTSKKTLSFRANGKIDVSQMAKDLVGGGGHVNASGGFFSAFKDGYNYKNIKMQIENLLKKSEEK